MIFISHRGNIDGPNAARENTVSYIQEALDKGFNVEIDVSAFASPNDFTPSKQEFVLGHSEEDVHNARICKSEECKVNLFFLLENKERLWIHTKNHEALFRLKGYSSSLNFFWHEDDEVALTSKNELWTHVECGADRYGMDSVVLIFNKEPIHIFNFRGICSDHIEYYRKRYRETYDARPSRR